MRIGEATLKRMLELCKERNITINKLAKQSDLTQSTLNSWNLEGTGNPSILTIKKICEGLNIPFVEFFNSEVFSDLEQEVQ